MLYDVINAKYLKDYKITLVFEDGKTGIVDFSNYLDNKGVFADFKDINYFKKFSINKDLGTICWPGGQDIAPETLYSKLA
ncbi:MAG: DUF2442 domain-containing protein [bacterium]